MQIFYATCGTIFAVWCTVDIFWRISTWKLRRRKLELEGKGP